MARVLVCGSAVIDFVFSVQTFPDKAEKYRAQDAQVVGGGCAANAAVAIRRLGGEAQLAARLGEDQVGDLILTGLRREGVDLSGVLRGAGRSSFSSVTVDARGERQILNYRDDSLRPDPCLLATLALEADGVLADTRWPEAGTVVLEAARAAGRPAVVDAEAPCPPDMLSKASHVAFSAQGLAAFTGQDGVEAGLQAAHRALGVWVCVTQGEQGAWWQDATGQGHVPALPVAARDTLGAGDVWHGAFALALAEGQSEGPAMAFAAATAALKCTRKGGREGTPTRAEVVAFQELHR
ncbi:MAG: PfkB family carbohydrate kinase [Pseudomonadota bacterium]